MQTFTYGKVRLALYALFALGILAVGLLGLRTAQGEGLLLVLGLCGLAAAAAVVSVRYMFGRLPAVGIGPEGLSIARLGGLVSWAEIAAVHLRWTKRRALLVIPLNSPELVLDVPKSAGYWRRGGIGRTLSRWLSSLAEDHSVLVNLNGLSGGKPERVVDAIAAVRPDLVRPTEVRTQKAE